MIKEEGVVTNSTETTAWIKTVRSTACEACEAKDSCEILNNKNAIHFKVKNTLNVNKGDRVVVGVKTRPLLFLTFMLYVFPVFLLLIGAVAGNNLADTFNTDQNLTAMFSGFILFLLAILIIKIMNFKFADNWKYKPFLVKISKNL